MFSNHLEDAPAAIVRQNSHHTPTYWRREDRVMKTISIYGDDDDGQRPTGKFGQDAGVTPLLFFKGHFFMTTESQVHGLTSHSKDAAFFDSIV